MKQNISKITPTDGNLETTWLDLNKELVKSPRSTYGITANGDAPELGINHGDLLIVDREATPRHGEIVIVDVGGEWFIRQHRIKLALAGTPPAPVFGVVLHLIRSYRKEGQ